MCCRWQNGQAGGEVSGTAAALRVMGFRDEGFERQRTEKGTRLWGGASLPCGFPPVEQLTD